MKKTLVILIFALVVTAGVRTTATFSWDYPDSEITNVTFNLYFSTNAALPTTNWLLLTNVIGTNAAVNIAPGSGFFFATASNEFGESLPSNIAQAIVPRVITGAKIK